MIDQYLAGLPVHCWSEVMVEAKLSSRGYEDKLSPAEFTRTMEVRVSYHCANSESWHNGYSVATYCRVEVWVRAGVRVRASRPRRDSRALFAYVQACLSRRIKTRVRPLQTLILKASP